MIDIRDLLLLSSVPRIGPQKIRALISHFKTPSNVLHAAARDLIRVPGIDRKLASNILHRTDNERFVDEQLRRVNKLGARIITIWDKEYPNLLKKIYDPPTLLYMLGTVQESDNRSIAIVGTRHPTAYGQSMAEKFAHELNQHSLCIVSGLARGIDTVVHSTVLRDHGRTIAVIGSGLDVPYPAENRKLMERIGECGVVLSEFPMGAKPDAPNFPRRNRIISGLTLGTIVIESAEDGGAMITASTALDQNREVFAVPGTITEKRSSGPHKLIRDGRAKLITSVEDIFIELQSQCSFEFSTERENTIPPLNALERELFEIITLTPQHIDNIADIATVSPSDALVTLLSLEFKNLIRQLPGKYFIRS